MNPAPSKYSDDFEMGTLFYTLKNQNYTAKTERDLNKKEGAG